MRLPDNEVALEVIAGWVGEAVGVDFVSHIRLANDLPEIEDIVKDPTKAKVPERADAQFILATMMAHHATTKTIAPMVTYIQRMGIEMQIMFVTLAKDTGSALLYGREMSEWISKNQELLMATIA